MKQDEFTLRPSQPAEESRFVKEMLGKLPPSRAAISHEKKKAIPSRISVGIKSPGPDYVWVPELKKWMHFVFARVHKYPPARRKTPEPWPKESEFCFLNRGLPYLKFKDKKAIDALYTKSGGSNKPYKVWTCIFCKQLHQIPFPIDDSTSGKTPRIWEFLIAHGHSPEEVYGLTPK